jgi:catechol 2,3-dioxygenase-like lactoylglutathione lyase family enzyme
VPVGDQDRARAFFVDVLGLEPVADFRYAGGERWLEVAPAGAATRLSLALRRDGPQEPAETGVTFVSDDVEAEHARLRDAGVDVDAAILREGDEPVRWAHTMLAGIPAMFRLRDPDGNSYLVVQQV